MSDDTTSPQNVEAPEVQPDQAASANREANLDAILDVPVTLTREIGRTTLPIKELLSLGQGSVIELERLIGEPHDVLVNGTLIAQGEVVVVGDQFGIRFTDIVSPAERVQRRERPLNGGERRHLYPRLSFAVFWWFGDCDRSDPRACDGVSSVWGCRAWHARQHESIGRHLGGPA